jgi:GT2 family glycosyltransferase
MEPLKLGNDVTIAVAAHGNVDVTRHCLDAILRSASGDFELLLIDDCSPESVEMVSLYEEFSIGRPNTKIYSFTENLEYTGSMSAILSHAAGQRVFFVSNDIFITPLYLKRLLEAADAHPRAGIVRGSSNFVDNGSPNHNIALAGPINNPRDLMNVAEEIDRRFGSTVLSDPYLCGDAFLVTRSVIDAIGAFDPRFFGYFGDMDYGLRARIAGFDLVLVPAAFAYHLAHTNFTYLPEDQLKAKLERRKTRVGENWERFKLKYELPVSLPLLSWEKFDWDALAKVAFDPQRHYSAPRDFQRYLL